MRKSLYVGSFVFTLLLGGCYFQVNGTMCDQIRADPHQIVPQECRKYNEKDAEKASNPQQNSDVNNSQIIEFTPKKEK